jgi:hypothetical protein
MHRNEDNRSRRGAPEGGRSVVEDRKRCGWTAVLAAVALCGALLLAVPPAPATAADRPVPVVARHTIGGFDS